MLTTGFVVGDSPSRLELLQRPSWSRDKVRCVCSRPQRQGRRSGAAEAAVLAAVLVSRQASDAPKRRAARRKRGGPRSVGLAASYASSAFSSTLEDGEETELPALPKLYSAEAVAEACRGQPLQVVARCVEVLGRVGGWVLAAALQRVGSGGRDDKASDAALAAELRQALAALGPSFVKVGQMLSSRVDLLPPAYIAELQLLTDRVGPFPKEAAESILDKAWGRLPAAGGEVSGSRALAALAAAGGLPSQPVAAASLGQVYRLDLEGHGPVAVKVQRPGIRGQICIDLFILRLAATTAQGWLSLNTDLPGLVDEYGARLVDELDFGLEAERALAFQKAAEGLDLISVCSAALPVLGLTTRRVLVTDWVDGERLEVTAARDAEEAKRLQTVAITAFLAMLLESGSLHADPHWGNLLRAKDGRLFIIDWGLVADIPALERHHLRQYVAHIVAGDYDAVPADLVALGFIAKGKQGAIEEEVAAAAISDVFRRLASGGGAQQRVADIMPAIAEVRKRHGNIGQIPSSFVYILRAFSILEGHGLRLDENYRLVDDCYPYLASWVMRARSAEARPLIRSVLHGRSARSEFPVPDAEQVLSLVRGITSYLQQAVLSPVTVAGDVSVAQEVRSLVKRLARAEALQDVVLEEVARASDVLMREAMDTAGAPFGPQRTAEDQAVLASLQKVVAGLAEEASLALEEAASLRPGERSRSFERLLQDLSKRFGGRQRGLTAEASEVAAVAGVLLEAVPLAGASLLRFSAQMLDRVERRFEPEPRAKTAPQTKAGTDA